MPAVQAKESTAKEITKRRIAAPRKTKQWRRAALESLYKFAIAFTCGSLFAA